MSWKNVKVVQSAEMVIDDHETARVLLGDPVADMLFDQSEQTCDVRVGMVVEGPDGAHWVVEGLADSVVQRHHGTDRIVILTRTSARTDKATAFVSEIGSACGMPYQPIHTVTLPTHPEHSDSQMSDEQIAWYENLGERWTRDKVGPIIARYALVELTTEIRRLRRALKLSELSRGVLGQD